MRGIPAGSPLTFPLGVSVEPPLDQSPEPHGDLSALRGGGPARVMQRVGAPPDSLPQAPPLASLHPTGFHSTLSSRLPL